MNRTALTNIAPDIFRKRLLVEGYFQNDMAESVLRDYFRHITSVLGLRTYGDPIIHKTTPRGRDLLVCARVEWPINPKRVYVSVHEGVLLEVRDSPSRGGMTEIHGRFAVAGEDGPKWQLCTIRITGLRKICPIS
jgi:hypothetical protein